MVGTAQQSAVGSACSGITTINPAPAAIQTSVGKGDYLEIAGLQDGTGSATAAGSALADRICGVIWDATAGGAQTAHQTACTYSTPFKVGVHFDNDEAIAPGAVATEGTLANLDHCENCPGTIVTNSGRGYQGFYLAYWQNTCYNKIILYILFHIYLCAFIRLQFNFLTSYLHILM